MKKLLYFLLVANSLLLTACSINKQISKEANKAIFADSNFTPAHVGISIYDPSTNQYLYNYQGDKYFVPASNTKLLTCYAAMKHLGDSLVGLRYFGDSSFAIFFKPTGDPTFLHPDFKNQKVLDLFNSINTKELIVIDRDTIKSFKQFESLGRGWAWDDYSSDYMAERSELPIAGNVVTISLNKVLQGTRLKGYDDYNKLYSIHHFKTNVNFFDSVLHENMNIHYSYTFYNDSGKWMVPKLTLKRQHHTNKFDFDFANKAFSSVSIPFLTDQNTIQSILADTLRKRFFYTILAIQKEKDGKVHYHIGCPGCRTLDIEEREWQTIHSQPTDSLLKPMMHRSDNFFAEQSLLMVSNETLGYMSDTKIIDSLLQTDYKQMPQKPKWVDGSGLSRYNLITPQDFVFVLNKMKQDFTWERITTILPTGNEGTLVGLYKNHIGKIYAKTGTLSNNVALSGFITTNKGRQLIFSILVNNHQTSASNIRKSIEKFLVSIMDKN